MPIATSYGTSRYQSGEADCVFLPKRWKGDGTRIGIVWEHSAGQTAAGIKNAANTGQYTLAHAVAEYFPVVVADLGGQLTWGNATAQTRLGTARSYLQSTYGAKAGPVVLIGVSMGGLLAVNWAKNNPSLVACIAGITPASDLADLRDNDRAGHKADIESAWGIASGAPLPAGANPATDYAGAVGIPAKAWYSTGDTLVLPATVTDLWGTKLGGQLTVVGTMDHGESAVAAVDVHELFDFIEAHI